VTSKGTGCHESVGPEDFSGAPSFVEDEFHAFPIDKTSLDDLGGAWLPKFEQIGQKSGKL
jgi:hypothetical protein